MILLRVIDTQGGGMYGAPRIATIELSDDVRVENGQNGLTLVDATQKRTHLFNKAGEYVYSIPIQEAE